MKAVNLELSDGTVAAIGMRVVAVADSSHGFYKTGHAGWIDSLKPKPVVRWEHSGKEHQTCRHKLKMATQSEAEGNRPCEHNCSITQEVMVDPVIATDGHTYERAAIQQWLEEHHTSPLTKQHISSTLIPNHALRNLIQDFRHAQQ